ncbi:FkbM family methyltransferase [Ensifer adhaerens]
MITAKVGEPGYAIYGPYIDLPAGKYAVQFRLAADGISPISCGHVDVCRDGGQTVIAKRKFSPLSIRTNSGVIEVPFETDAPGSYEFRVVTTGKSEFQIGDRSLKMDRDYFGTSETANRPVIVDEFFLKAAPHFRHLSTYGGALSVSQGKPVMSFNGLKMLVENEEDFQVLAEVHVFNEYNFETSDRCCVIDIGMNVGFASLYFAGLENVTMVHSFEPFEAPYRRAIENIALNPHVAAKITPHNMGLAAATETKSVGYDAAFTISTSVQGNGGSNSTNISLANATEALSGIIDRAKTRGEAVVIKMDCEGSEFEIFEDLAASGLLSEVNILMVEWHKWWSKEKSDRDLIKLMVERGFTTFNKTHLSNPNAGMIYAAKSRN